MSFYIHNLNAQCERREQERAERERANAVAAKQKLIPLEQRLKRLLDTIPPDVQREGLSLPSLQASLRGRSRGNCHPGELGAALRKLGFTRSRRWRGEDGFRAVWRLSR